MYVKLVSEGFEFVVLALERACSFHTRLCAST